MIAFGIDKDDLGKITVTVIGAKVIGTDVDLGEVTLIDMDSETEDNPNHSTVMDEIFDDTAEAVKNLTIRKEE